MFRTTFTNKIELSINPNLKTQNLRKQHPLSFVNIKSNLHMNALLPLSVFKRINDKNAIDVEIS